MPRRPQTAPDLPEAPRIVWPLLIRGRLVRRYKRFLADVELADGRTVTAHCPNSGSMRGCAAPGRPIYLSTHATPRRKLPYTWELIAMPDSLVGVNTLVPNRLVARSAAAGAVPELAHSRTVRTEVTVGAHTRLDIVLEDGNGRRTFVEVKNCTLVEGGRARFPDAVTARGKKHLEVLTDLHRQGHRSVIFFLVQRMDASAFSPADHIDAAYGDALRRAVAAGVEALAYDVAIDLGGICLRRRLPVALSPGNTRLA